MAEIDKHLKAGSRVVVKPNNDKSGIWPASGVVITQTYRSNDGQLIKVMHDDGLEKWYPADWVKPLLRSI